MKTTQPRLLYSISFTNIWERYGFYTTRTILVLYMTQFLGFSDIKSYEVFSATSALLYLTPVLGGYIADNLLGIRKSMILGSILLISGYFIMGLPEQRFLYLGLSLNATGIGFFIPNIATAVGRLYQTNDKRRDAGFSFFYACTNIGAFIPPLFVAYLIKRFNWSTAFIMASFSLVLALITFYFATRKKSSLRIKLNNTYLKARPARHYFYFAIGLFLTVIIFGYLINNFLLTNTLVLLFGCLFVLVIIKKSFSFNKATRNGIFAALVLTLVSIIFWALYQQAVMSLTIFTEFNVQRTINGWKIPTVMFQSVNPLIIIIFGPLMGKLWISLAKRNLDPSIPIKFMLGILFMGSGFILIQIITTIPVTIHHSQINFIWIILSYFLQTIGELLLSPIGLSMITELSPISISGLMMGIWYFATALANLLAGLVSEMTTVPSGTNNPAVTTPVYSHIFGTIGWTSVIISFLFLLVVPMIKKAIKHAIATGHPIEKTQPPLQNQ